MTIVFSNEADFDAVKAAYNAATPDVELGSPAMSTDGRCAANYPVSWPDAEKLDAACASAGVSVTKADAMPPDWVEA